jgi:hypothetical protein
LRVTHALSGAPSARGTNDRHPRALCKSAPLYGPRRQKGFPSTTQKNGFVRRRLRGTPRRGTISRPPPPERLVRWPDPILKADRGSLSTSSRLGARRDCTFMTARCLRSANRSVDGARSDPVRRRGHGRQRDDTSIVGRPSSHRRIERCDQRHGSQGLSSAAKSSVCQRRRRSERDGYVGKTLN